LLSDVPIARGLRLTSNITASVWRIYANGEREILFNRNFLRIAQTHQSDIILQKLNLARKQNGLVPEVQIPPLLFISFVENAFKHGVSYRKESFVHVVMQLEEGNQDSANSSK